MTIDIPANDSHLIQKLPTPPSKDEILAYASKYIKSQNELFKNSAYYVDEPTAIRAIKFISLLRHTAGEYAGKPFGLLPFQIEFIIDIVATFKKADNTRRYAMAVLFIPRKNGKALAIDTQIPTPGGFKSMGELKVGDMVYDELGKPTPIIATTEVMHSRPCYEIVFSDGEKIVCDAQHEWVVHIKGKRQQLTTKRLYRLLHLNPVVQTAAGQSFKFKITPTPSVPVKCIQVKGGVYLCGKSFKPTHNSELIAATLLYFLFVDPEKGKEIYCAANETDQAKIVYKATISMLNQNPKLKTLARAFKATRTLERTGEFDDFIKVLTANADTKDGLRPYVLVYDELHAAKNGELLQVLQEGTASRSNSLSIIISTAGYNTQGEMYQLYEYAKKVKSKVIKDDSFYSKMFYANEEHWEDEQEWIKANPAIGYGVKLDKLRQMYQRAKHDPEKARAFKTKHLNIWASAPDSWIAPKIWQANTKGLSLDDIRGVKFYGGLDLASVSDLTAFVLYGELDDGTGIILPYMWCPEENVRARGKADRVSYERFIAKGLLKTTPGNVIDFDFIREDILKISQEYKPEIIAYDRYMAAGIVSQLADAGLNMVSFAQGFVSFSPPTKELYAKLARGECEHFNNECLAWQAMNVVLETDAMGNIKPSKKKSGDKIDGMVALVMAYGIRSISTTLSPYENKELFII